MPDYKSPDLRFKSDVTHSRLTLKNLQVGFIQCFRRSASDF